MPKVKPRTRAGRTPLNGRAEISRKTPLAELPELLTVDEFGAYLGIERGLAYREARRLGVRVGRLLRVPRKAIAALTGAAGRAT